MGTGSNFLKKEKKVLYEKTGFGILFFFFSKIPTVLKLMKNIFFFAWNVHRWFRFEM